MSDDVAAQAALRDERIIAEQAESVPDAQDDQESGPLDHPATQGALALTATGAVAAAIGCGRRLLALAAAKGVFTSWFGLPR